MTWRSCADDPPDKDHRVLVRYTVLPHLEASLKNYEVAYWWGITSTKLRRWRTNDGCDLTFCSDFANAEWTEIPE